MFSKRNTEDPGEVREVYGFKREEDKKEIYYFLKGAVYCWCNKHPEEWFSMRDFMGGNNYYWEGTPLEALYRKHIASGKTKEQAIEAAGKDSGWLLKKVIKEDKKREFYTKKEELIRKYKWDRTDWDI